MIRSTQLATAIATALLSLGAFAQATTPTADATAPAHHGMFAHALKKLDTDGDGRISLAEYLAGASMRFQAADTAHAGTLSAAQLASSPRAQKHNLRVANMLVRHLDTAQKGYVTADDFVSAAQKRFARIDTQGTGKITLDQFSAAPAARFRHAALASGTAATSTTDADAAPGTRAAFRQKFAQTEFAKLDTNGDGVVTQAEFVAAAKSRFAALDTQNAGKLTAQQIATSQVAQQRDLKFAQAIVKKLDTNGDGVISQDEYLAGAKARFARLDKNGDGYLDANDGGRHRWSHGKDAQPST